MQLMQIFGWTRCKTPNSFNLVKEEGGVDFNPNSTGVTATIFAFQGYKHTDFV